MGHLLQKQKVLSHFSLFININNHSRFGSIYDQYIRFPLIKYILHPPNLKLIPSSPFEMPSIQKIILALALAATALSAQISDGQLQQPTTPVAVVKQITDGQLQQVTSTPVAVVK